MMHYRTVDREIDKNGADVVLGFSSRKPRRGSRGKNPCGAGSIPVRQITGK